ncbi:MAG: rhomboid family intramembrane serine protease [Bacteriovoracaceae bacterium]|nr:rhomboid family intramembrane serine protease [Bacteriovoracaceae bacterium]
MQYESQFISNFLSKKRFSYGIAVSLGTFIFCTIMSNLYWTQAFSISKHLAASPSLVLEKGEIWRLFTTSLIHSDIGHLLSNSLVLLGMGYYVSTYYGYWIYPLVSFLLGGVVNLIVLLTFKHDITLLGASGVAYFLWGFWLILYLNFSS